MTETSYDDNNGETEHSPNVCLDRRWSPLPQPHNKSGGKNIRYQYVLYEDIETTYFTSSTSKLPKDTLCWILKSKGSAKGERELFLRARVVHDDEYGNDNENENDNGDRRVLIRYPKGSTYHVKRSNLIPVLERSTHPNNQRQQHIVIVMPETNDYRRAAVVHTCENESFLEIGCSYGPTVDRMRKVLTEIGHVTPLMTLETKTSPLKEEEEEEENDNGNNTTMKTQPGESSPSPVHKSKEDPPQSTTAGSSSTSSSASLPQTSAAAAPTTPTSTSTTPVYSLGIDKSEECIDIANHRYPQSLFSLEDALTQKGITKLRSLCQQTLVNGYPSVVAIDINGTRELPAVLQCITHQMQPGTDVTLGDNWELPRLLIVKSRTLYADIQKRYQLGLQC